ncbi:MAG: hypothetical protein ABW032_09785 [Burkholderiaceae bacterium]
MSLTTDTSFGSSHSALNAREERARAAEAPPNAIVAGLEDLASAPADAVSATVTLSAQALGGIENAVGAAVDFVEQGAEAVGHAIGSGWHSLVNGVEAAAGEAATLVGEAVALPFTIASEVGHAAMAVIEDGSGLAGKALGLAALGQVGGLKLIDAVV